MRTNKIASFSNSPIATARDLAIEKGADYALRFLKMQNVEITEELIDEMYDYSGEERPEVVRL